MRVTQEDMASTSKQASPKFALAEHARPGALT